MAGWGVLEIKEFSDALACEWRGVDLKIAVGMVSVQSHTFRIEE